MNNQKNSITQLIALIEVSNLSKKLSTSANETLLILDDINLTIEQGESVAIT